MNYKIVKFNKQDGQVFIEYDAEFPPIVIDVPIKDNLFIVGQELHDYIQGFIPVWHLERLRQLKAGIANAQEIEALVQPSSVVQPPVIEAPIVNQPVSEGTQTL